MEIKSYAYGYYNGAYTKTIEILGTSADSVSNGNGITNEGKRNAIGHALTSAEWASASGHLAAQALGNFKEYITTTTMDTKRDQYNNEVGRRIAAYADSLGLTGSEKTAAIDDLVMDALDMGDLVTELSDFRLTIPDASLFLWTEPSPFWEGFSQGRDYTGLDPATATYLRLSDYAKDMIFDYFDDFKDTIVKPISDIIDGISDLFDFAESTGTPGGYVSGSPLVLDLSLDSSGIQLIAPDSPDAVYWDITRDGLREATGWIGAGMGLLAADINANGQIDNNTELFGNEEENGYGNGFVKLATYDSNSDGHINALDTNFSNLKVWTDINGDGVSQIEELHTLTSLGITDINLGYSNVNYQIAGNAVLQQSSFTMNGNTRAIVDAWFSFSRENTVYNGELQLNPQTLYLPSQRGYGEILDLDISMSQNPNLLDMVADLAAKSTEDILSPSYDLKAVFEGILFEWAGVTSVNPTSRGANIDARKLEFLEKLVGKSFLGGAGADPDSTQAGYLDTAWNDAFKHISANVLLQTDFGKLVGSPTYNPITDTFSGLESPSVALHLDPQAGGWATGNADTVDIYLFRAGDTPVSSGVYSVTDYGTSANNGNMILFAGIDPGDVRMWVDDTGNLVIYYTATDAISIAAGRDITTSESLVRNVIEKIVFDDGTVWNIADGIHLINDASGRNIIGTSGDDIMTGDAGVEIMYGYGGNDTLVGGEGADGLIGSTGDDSYVFNPGDSDISTGADTITENLGEGTDRIVLHGVLPQDVYLWTDAYGTLHVKYTATDEILVSASTTGAGESEVGSYVEQIVFDDNTVWDLTAGLRLVNDNTSRVLYGSSFGDTMVGGTANDTMYGYGGNDVLNGGDGADMLNGGDGADTLSGGLGDDYLEGGAGDDLFIYTAGLDSVSESYGASTDTLKISGGYTINDITFATTTYDLKVVLASGVSEVTLSAQLMGNPDYQIEKITFDDGFTTSLLDYSSWTWGTSGANSITGASGHDVIIGLAGNDTLNGGNGDDDLHGGAGTDTLNGGAGADQMAGGAGNDTFVVDNAGDIVLESAGEGTDLVQSSISYALTANVENLTLTGSSNINGTGNNLDNSITGNSGVNILTGNDGNDTLNGGTGADTMIGGTGNDTYIVDNAGDVVTENASEGIDTIQSSITLTLGSNVENLTLTGSSNINGTGNSLDNVITGNTGVNILNGGGGNDTLNGGTGADTMIGGTGDDVYVVDNASDVVTENASEGIDTIQSSITISALAANVENLTLTGASVINGTGNSLDNVIIGNTAVNILTGGGGNDTLNGGTGADTMIGGTGDDLYIVDNASDVVTENASEGTDTIQSSVTISALAANVENLTLTGASAINGTGNALDNVIIGNTGVNTLNGGGGNDTLDGGVGADTMIGGTGNDVFIVDNANDVISENASEGTDLALASVSYTIAANVENLTLTGIAAINGTGNTGVNILTGNTADNTLNGGTGADTMIGGAGNDTYIVDNASDVVTENANEGIDTVSSSITISSLAANVENLTLTGASVINGTGNSLDNVIIGNTAVNILYGLDGNDTLNGGTGADTMIGGTGNDTYIVDNASDVVTESASEGVDTIQSSVTISALAANVENLTLTGASAINGTGNTLDNVIIGNTAVNTLTGGGGNDTLDGGAGADTMIGGTGNDTYIVDNTSDVTTENASEGMDTVLSSVTRTLGSNLENLTLTGISAINGTGNSLDNVIIGNTAVNTLTGGGGNDTLDGGAGADTMIGGTGNDTYIVDNASDVVTENSAEGTDTVRASLNYTLGANVESLVLTGTDHISGTGNSAANTLTGNAGNNTLDGSVGADTMIGGAGNDVYIVDNAGDVVTENSAEGIDTVRSSVTITLGSNVENLTLTGASAINGTGNTLDNVIIGNTAVNTLTGGAGNDTLDGGMGADTMIGGTGDDIFYVNEMGDVVTENSAEGTDTVYSSISYSLGSNVENLFLMGSGLINATGNSLTNTLRGNTGNNTLDGGVGADTMMGGIGSDVYIVDNTGDVIIENASEGFDAVQSSVSFTLAANVEKLTLTGASALNGTGNSIDNVIIGNSGVNTLTGLGGNDTLDGGTGADTMIGGTGDDVYYVDNASDVVTESASEGIDLVYSSLTHTLASNVENLILTGTSAINGTGNSSDNLIVGNGGANTLTGNDGHDTIYGGNGNDIINGNNGNDTLSGDLGNDTLSGGAGDDLYIYTAGLDTMNEGNSSGTDTLLISGGVTINDITTSQVSSNAKIVIASGVDEIIITNQHNVSTNYHIEKVAFDDGFVTTLEDHLSWTWGTSGADSLTGTSGHNVMIGKAGNDIINAAGGNDDVHGGAGDDTLYGGSGNDLLHGGIGDDRLYGQDGLDTMIGGEGQDRFIFEAASAFNNVDVIKDFNFAQYDILDIADILIGFSSPDLSSFVKIDVSGNDSIVSVDRDGTGGTYGWAQVVKIEGVTNLNVQEMADYGRLATA